MIKKDDILVDYRKDSFFETWKWDIIRNKRMMMQERLDFLRAMALRKNKFISYALRTKAIKSIWTKFDDFKDARMEKLRSQCMIFKCQMMLKRHVRRQGAEFEERGRRRTIQRITFHHRMLYGESQLEAKEMVVGTIKAWQQKCHDIGELLDGADKVIWLQRFWREFSDTVKVKHQYVVGLWENEQREMNEAELLRKIPPKKKGEEAPPKRKNYDLVTEDIR